MITIPETEPADPADAMAEKLYWQLYRIMSVLRRSEFDRTSGGAMTLTQCSVLYFLSEHRRARMTELASAERVALPTMTKAIRRLCDLGMVRRVRDVGDHRNVWVVITPKGLRTQSDAVTALSDSMRTVLSATEIDSLREALAPIERLAFGAESMPAPLRCRNYS